MGRSHETGGGGSKGICEKIRRSLAASPAKQLNGVSVLPASKNYVHENGVVPIEFERSAFAKGKNSHRIDVAQGIPKRGGHGQLQSFPGHNIETDTKMNDEFSDYIRDAKKKITGTSSDVGWMARSDVGGMARSDTVNMRATAYIDRARLRIRNSATFSAASFHKK